MNVLKILVTSLLERSLGRYENHIKENEKTQPFINQDTGHSCKDGHNKGQIRKDQTETEEIKKRWQEDTEELYKKDLNDSDNHDRVVTHLEPEILECEVILRKHYYKQN